MWKEKLGNYLIDVSKYIFTGVVVASLFKDMEDNKWLIYGLGFTSSILALIAGLVLTNKKKEDSNGSYNWIRRDRHTLCRIFDLLPYAFWQTMA